MPLAAGMKLGPYEILEKIGAGGMGEVYRARDTKLERDVAIKVLPDEVASDSERLARFEREAKLLASLNHPNIAALHTLEEFDGQMLLIMELVDGETLAELGVLSLDEALPLFLQLADGLAAAHDRGVIHRDLKPANVKVSSGDQVKILDFGLAKAFGEAPSSAEVDSSASPTRTKDTALGAIVGTAPYMSPEQARGKLVDKRTDVWAFGCCLYESLTGKRAFEGETVTDTLAAIMKSEPDLSKVPTRVRPLIERCLKKDASKRLRDVGDAHLLLHDDEPEASRERRPASALAIVAAVIAAALTGYLARRPPAADVAAEPTRLSLTLPEGQAIHYGFRNPNPLAVSPDGRSVVYVVGEDDTRSLYVRFLDELEPVALEGTEDAQGPFFSPDGEWVGFFAGSILKKVRPTGGPVVTVGPTPASEPTRGATWTPEGEIVFSFGDRSPLYTISDEGGEARELTVLDDESGVLGHRWPQAVDNGILYYADGPSSGSLLFLHPGSGVEQRVLEIPHPASGTPEGIYARYLSSGHLVYSMDRAGPLHATVWDPAAGGVASPGVPTVADVLRVPARGSVAFDVSRSGTLVYSRRYLGELVWVDRYGSIEPVGVGRAAGPRLSPDGSKLAYIDGGVGRTGGLFVLDLERDATHIVSNRGALTGGWHPDGVRLSVMWVEDQDEKVFVARADGSGEPILAFEFHRRRTPQTFSPDGRDLLFDSGGDIWRAPLDGDEPSPYLDSTSRETSATFSPDGRYVAYVSDKSGRYEIYVRDYPDGEREWIVSTNGGLEPRWSESGEIFYREGDRMMAVPVVTEPEFRAGRPEFLFEGPFESGPATRNQARYDVTADGQRFVMSREDPVERRRIHVVLNWTIELDELVPIEP